MTLDTYSDLSNINTQSLTGANVWKSTSAEHVRFIVNGEEYYQAVFDQIRQAESSICILAWQLDFATQLVRKGDGKDCSFANVLLQRLKEKPELEVFILVWDHPLIYAQDREKFNGLKVSLNFPSRVHFHWDPEHPFWASHHAKLLIFDGKIAYSGGMDIAVGRWDSSPHLSNNPCRKDSGLENYCPYHDVMVEMSGPIIRHLAEYFDLRWQFSGSRTPLNLKLAPVEKPSHQFRCDLVRTAPKYKTQKPVQEIEENYLALIQKAKHDIYIENQYISSESIVSALGKRLKQEHGPYITIILPYLDSLSIEGLAMGTTVGVLMEKLSRQDRHNRLLIVYPVTSDEPKRVVKVHSKIMVVDDVHLIMGSANLNERSMGLDTELDFIFSASASEEIQKHIITLKQKSLMSFTGKEFADDETQGKKLQERIRNSENFKQFLEDFKNNELRVWAKNNLPLDYKVPLSMEQGLEVSIAAGKTGTWKRIVRNFAITAILVAIGIYVGFNYDRSIQPLIGQFFNFLKAQKPPAVLLTLGFGILGGLFFPVNLFIIGVGLIFSTFKAIVCCLCGIFLASATSFLIGKWLGIRIFQKFFHKKLERLYYFFSKSHWSEIAVLRMVPLAPFAFIGWVSGASGVKFRTFLIGSFLGNLPGVILLLVFEKSLIDFLIEPSWQGGTLLLSLIALLGIAIYKVKKRFAYET